MCMKKKIRYSESAFFADEESMTSQFKVATDSSSRQKASELRMTNRQSVWLWFVQIIKVKAISC